MDGSDRAERGRRIDQKIAELGIGQREFQRETKIDRDTLVRAVAGDPTVRESTLKRIEAALEKWDEEMGSERDGMPSPELAEIHYVVEGEREIVVRGPVSQLPQLEESVARLVRKLGSKDQAS